MLDDTPRDDAPLTRTLQLQCRALAAVPHEFRGVSAWLNFNCAMIGQCDDPADVRRLMDDLKLARAALDEVLPYFSLTSNLPDYDPVAVEWFRSCLRQAPQQGAPFLTTGNMLHDIQDAVEAEAPEARAIMSTLSRYITDSLAPEVATLFRVLRRALEEQEALRLHWVTRMRQEGDEAVARIRSVSQMVRLISLNASVEAAHAGAAGKSFGVIAGEVKALSEQIEGSAQIATDTLRDLTDRL